MRELKRCLARLIQCLGANAEHSEKSFRILVVKVADILHRGRVLAVEGVGDIVGGVKGNLAFVKRYRNRAGRQPVEMFDEFPTGLGGGIEPVTLIDLF